MIKVCIAGGTGWAGSELGKGVYAPEYEIGWCNFKKT
jgi:hypothetical protein